MRVFLAGIIQGSRLDTAIHDQGYRDRIGAALREIAPEVDVIDVHATHPERLVLARDDQRSMFLSYVAEAAGADLMIAYLPEASMGTAVEMWAASQAGVPVLTVTPLRTNWVVFSLSTAVFPTVDDLLNHLRNGGLRGASGPLAGRGLAG